MSQEQSDACHIAHPNYDYYAEQHIKSFVIFISFRKKPTFVKILK